MCTIVFTSPVNVDSGRLVTKYRSHSPSTPVYNNMFYAACIRPRVNTELQSNWFTRVKLETLKFVWSIDPMKRPKATMC